MCEWTEVYMCVHTNMCRVDESLCNVEPSVGVEATPSLERRDTITTVDGECGGGVTPSLVSVGVG